MTVTPAHREVVGTHAATPDASSGVVLGRVGAVLVTSIVGGIVIVVALVAVGLLITGPLGSSVGHWDSRVSIWLYHHRTDHLNVLSAAGTWLAEVPVVIAAGLIGTAALAVKRLWDLMTMWVVGLVLEISTFMAVNIAVDRPRPPHGMEQRTTASFPSGHVAAAVVLYGALAVITWRLSSRPTLRRASIAVAVVVPVVVAVSRVYRDMHHVTDAAIGWVLGAGCLGVALLTRREADSGTG